jgi:hypothetical protein
MLKSLTFPILSSENEEEGTVQEALQGILPTTAGLDAALVFYGKS